MLARTAGLVLNKLRELLIVLSDLISASDYCLAMRTKRAPSLRSGETFA